MEAWTRSGAGVLPLPSGRLVRGRALRHPLPAGPLPQYAVYLATKPPSPVAWEARWVRWPDFWVPSAPDDARTALLDAWRRSTGERVEIGCRGGRGRTGTALACLAILDGVHPGDAVAYVRTHYDARAVETPWQRRFVESFCWTSSP